LIRPITCFHIIEAWTAQCSIRFLWLVAVGSGADHSIAAWSLSWSQWG